MKTYDIYFNDNNDSNSKGFEMTIEDAKDYIKRYNGTNHSYFEDYKGGTVSVVCNQDGETVYEEKVKYEKGGTIENNCEYTIGGL